MTYEEAIAQCVAMHEAGHFDGRSIVPQVGRILSLARRYECKTALDFGCGKAEYYDKADKDGVTLAQALADTGIEEITRYDPAVPRFAKPPEGTFDIVWCTDVLEHIPESDVGAVVDRLFALAGKVLLVSVSCSPAVKALPNGENAHVTLKTPEFWGEMFDAAAKRAENRPYKLVCRETDKPDTVLGTAHANIGPASVRVKSKNCVPTAEIQANMRGTQAALIPWMQAAREHDRKAIVIGGAPSLPSCLDEIRADVAAGGFVLCVKASHDWLIENGIVPRLCSMLDPRPHVKEWVQKPHPDVTYLIASMIHPTVAAHLAACRAKMRVYHAAVGAEEAKFALGGLTVAGGSTSGMRAVHCLHVMGFRSFKLYGFDSSYRLDGEDAIQSAHAKRPRTDHLWARPAQKSVLEIETVGMPFSDKPPDTEHQWFKTDPELLCQVRDLETLLQVMRSCRFEFGGDGLFQAYGRAVLDLWAGYPELDEVLA